MFILRFLYLLLLLLLLLLCLLFLFLFDQGLVPLQGNIGTLGKSRPYVPIEAIVIADCCREHVD